MENEKMRAHRMRNMCTLHGGRPFLVDSRKLKEYLVPDYKLNNLLSNYAFERPKLDWKSGGECRKKRMKLWQALEATPEKPRESMQHFRTFLWRTKKANDTGPGQDGRTAASGCETETGHGASYLLNNRKGRLGRTKGAGLDALNMCEKCVQGKGKARQASLASQLGQVLKSVLLSFILHFFKEGSAQLKVFNLKIELVYCKFQHYLVCENNLF